MQVSEDFRVASGSEEFVRIELHNTSQGELWSVWATVCTKNNNLVELNSFDTGEWFYTMEDALETIQDVIENE